MHLIKNKSFVKSNRTPRHCDPSADGRSNLILALLAISILFSCTTKKAPLPFIGEIDFDEKGDTVYHTIPQFSFSNQNGKKISEKDYEGKIYVTDFFFTTCGTICPKMTTQLTRIQEIYKNDNELKLLSFSVNPEIDSISTLKNYAQRFKVIDEKWNLCTGSRASINRLATKGFLVVPIDPNLNDSSQFIHSEMFILVDQIGRIRGSYDGTDSAFVNQLIEDIKTLKDELHSAE